MRTSALFSFVQTPRSLVMMRLLSESCGFVTRRERDGIEKHLDSPTRVAFGSGQEVIGARFAGENQYGKAARAIAAPAPCVHAPRAYGPVAQTDRAAVS